jgi:hypothetical protein
MRAVRAIKTRASLWLDLSIPYFKMRHAAGNPSGVFRNWRRDDVRKKVTGLVGILKRHARTAIHCTMPIALFDEIIGVEMAGFLKSPYSHTFYAMLAGIAWEAIDQKAERLELIFDEQDKYAQFIKNDRMAISERLERQEN